MCVCCFHCFVYMYVIHIFLLVILFYSNVKNTTKKKTNQEHERKRLIDEVNARHIQFTVTKPKTNEIDDNDDIDNLNDSTESCHEYNSPAIKNKNILFISEYADIGLLAKLW